MRVEWRCSAKPDVDVAAQGDFQTQDRPRPRSTGQQPPKVSWAWLSRGPRHPPTPDFQGCPDFPVPWGFSLPPGGGTTQSRSPGSRAGQAACPCVRASFCPLVWEMRGSGWAAVPVPPAYLFCSVGETFWGEWAWASAGGTVPSTW